MGRHLHLDMLGGLAGDMFLAAAIDAELVDIEALEASLRSLGLGAVRVLPEPAKRGAIAGTHVHFEGWDESVESDHRHLSTILQMLDDADLDPEVRQIASEMFKTLGEAEAAIHDMSLENVHFHECGALDSIFDFVSAAWVIAHTEASWSCSAIPTGSGTIETDHGTVPIPAPATMRLLEGLQTINRPVEAELVTPTGATILKTLADRHPGMQQPPGEVRRSGFGAGTRELDELSNVVRMVVLETTDHSQPTDGTGSSGAASDHRQAVVRLVCEIDDASPELVADAAERLRDAGALDVTAEPVGMKKNRSGVRLAVLADPDDEEMLAGELFRQTSTFGVRIERLERYALDRSIETVATAFGDVSVKVGRWKNEVIQTTPEYDDCRRLADEHDVPTRRVYRAALGALESSDIADRLQE